MKTLNRHQCEACSAARAPIRYASDADRIYPLTESDEVSGSHFGVNRGCVSDPVPNVWARERSARRGLLSAARRAESLSECGRDDEARAEISEARTELALALRARRKVERYGHALALRAALRHEFLSARFRAPDVCSAYWNEWSWYVHAGLISVEESCRIRAALR